MAPTAHVIVYYVHHAEDIFAEVIADSLDVELTGVLQNFVRSTPKYIVFKY